MQQRSVALLPPDADRCCQQDTGKICGGDGTFDCVESPFAAIRRLNVGGSTEMAVGCDIIDANISTAALEGEAVAAAKKADVAMRWEGLSVHFACTCSI